MFIIGRLIFAFTIILIWNKFIIKPISQYFINISFRRIAKENDFIDFKSSWIVINQIFIIKCAQGFYWLGFVFICIKTIFS